MSRLFKILLFTIALSAVQSVLGQEDEGGETDAEEQQRLEREEQQVLQLREHILAGNGFEIQRALTEITNLTTLARGFRFEPEDAAIFLRETPQRVGDPDVNAIRGFAEAARRQDGDPKRLAEAFTLVLSLQGDRYLTNPAGTFMGLFESLSNATAMQLILDTDPAEQEAEEEEDNRRKSLRRQLLVRGGDNSTDVESSFEGEACTDCANSASSGTATSASMSQTASGEIVYLEATNSSHLESSSSSSSTRATTASSSTESTSSSSSETFSSATAKTNVSDSPATPADTVPQSSSSPNVEQTFEVLSPKEEPESRNLSERVRAAILAANIDLLAKLIVTNDDVTELALGFTFPPQLRSLYLFESPFRLTDPDVVSLKGMAQAILMAQQASKLAEIFIDAVYGTDFDENVCPDPSPSQKVVYSRKGYFHKTATTVKMYTSSSSHASKSSFTITYTSPSGNKTVTIVHSPAPYQSNQTMTENIRDDEDETGQLEEPLAVASSPAVSPESPSNQNLVPIPECFTREEIKTIRDNLLEDFSNLELMRDIRDSDPREDSRRRRRNLLVIGTPVNTWPCASCWKPRFCNKNAYWCPQ